MCDGFNFCTGISHVLDTSDYNNIRLSFALSDIGNQFEDHWRADFSIDGGATWINAVTIVTPPLGYNQPHSVDLSAINPAVENNPNVQIRFWQEETFSGEDSYLDEITIIGDYI
jgi:hypothetical protein